jgi:carboxyl-terminal processing protease
MRRPYNFIYPLFFAVVTGFGMLVGIELTNSDTYANNVAGAGESSTDSKFEEVMNFVESRYVDSVNTKKLTKVAIQNMLDEMDPHSVYIPAKRRERMNSELEGNFEGIGIQFNIIQDTIAVISPIEGGPSEKLGIQTGDKIIEVEGDDVAGIGITNQKVVDLLRGEKGTKVDVTIKRPGVKDPLQFTITRDKIPIHSVRASYMIDDKTGYIKVNRFSANTTQEFREAMNELRSEGMENLMLDLRGNPGGYLRASIRMADAFLEKGKNILYTNGRAKPKQTYDATRRGDFEEGKLAILINEGSASASEIVSGAVQDHDRGLIVGRRSFGKGLVQEPKEFSDGSALRLTVARYYTPTGRSIQKPYEQGVEEYRKDIMERYQHGEFIYKDSIDFADSLKYKTPKGRTVYGGGGIMPDIFIPIDTVLNNSKFLTKLRQNGLINRFALQFVDKYRSGIEDNYPSRSAFINEFDAEGRIFNQFVNFIRKEDKVDYNRSAMREVKSFVLKEIKGLIGRQFWENDIYYQISNKTDETYQQALQKMESNAYSEMNLEQ